MEIAVNRVNGSTCAALKGVISDKSECQNSILMKEQIKEVLMELTSAQLVIRLLQEELTETAEHGSIVPSSNAVWKCKVVNNNDDRNLVHSKHVTKTSDIVRNIAVPPEASNCYSVLDNSQDTSGNPVSGDVWNIKLINSVIPDINYFMVATVHHSK